MGAVFSNLCLTFNFNLLELLNICELTLLFPASYFSKTPGIPVCVSPLPPFTLLCAAFCFCWVIPMQLPVFSTRWETFLAQLADRPCKGDEHLHISQSASHLLGKHRGQCARELEKMSAAPGGRGSRLESSEDGMKLPFVSHRIVICWFSNSWDVPWTLLMVRSKRGFSPTPIGTFVCTQTSSRQCQHDATRGVCWSQKQTIS